MKSAATGFGMTRVTAALRRRWHAMTSGPEPGAAIAELPEELRRVIDLLTRASLGDALGLGLLWGLAHDLDARVPGDVVECGVYRGGSAAAMAAGLAPEPARRLWLYDTFAGLPAPGERDAPETARYTGQLVASPAEALEVVRQVGFPPERVVVRAGLFSETFPQAPLPERIALLHVDADWYDSVRLCLETLYPRVAPGGYVVLDDFGHWEGTREAFYDFCEAHKLRPLLERMGYSKAFWRKDLLHHRDTKDRFVAGLYRPGHGSPSA